MERDSRFWELLAKRSAGEATGQELKELNSLLQYYGTDVDYMMSVMEHYWEEVSKATEDNELSQQAEERATNDLNKLSGALSPEIFADNKKTKRRRIIYWSVAATVAACLVIAFLVWQPFSHSKAQMDVAATKDGSRLQLTLPDGSEVWLNSGSRLIYPKNMNHLSCREVTLCGEAYFKVKHDEDRPFIIHTDYLDIKDLGTVFNVKAYPDDGMAVATLISGSIAVSIRNDPGRTIILKPHEKVSYFANTHQFSFDNKNNENREIGKIHPIALRNSRLEVSDIQPVVDAHQDTIVAETAWINNELVFQGEKFSELAERMERWYNVTIHIENEQVADYTFSGIFQGETLSQALEELKMIRAFNFEMEYDTVVIK